MDQYNTFLEYNQHNVLFLFALVGYVFVNYGFWFGLASLFLNLIIIISIKIYSMSDE